MAKPKRKLPAAQKRGSAQFTTVFINGKQRRVRRPALIGGLEPDEFYLRNADLIALHQDKLWECLEAEHGDIAFTNANDEDCFGRRG